MHAGLLWIQFRGWIFYLIDVFVGVYFERFLTRLVFGVVCVCVFDLRAFHMGLAWVCACRLRRQQPGEGRRVHGAVEPLCSSAGHGAQDWGQGLVKPW